MIKSQLQRINARFRAKQEAEQFTPNPDNLIILKRQGTVKNFLRLANKTMIGLNKVRVSRWWLFSGFLGLFLGHACNQIDDGMTALRKNLKPTLNEVIIKEVLRNQQIKDNLKKELKVNVFDNFEVQYGLHEVLYWKSIKPQMKQLLDQSRKGIAQTLRDRQTRQGIAKVAAEAIAKSQPEVESRLVEWLRSDGAVELVRSGLGGYFHSQDFYEMLSRQVRGAVSKGLSSQENMEQFYTGVRQKLMSW